MKRLITMVIMVLAVAVAMAQAPEKFTYQAVVRNVANQLVTNAQVGVRVSVLQGVADGEALYVETHSAATNANGLLTLEVGGGKAEQGAFDGIDWSHGPFFLKTEIDPDGGGSYSITSVQQLLSVPYALYAKEAANSFSGDYNDLRNKPAIPRNVGELTNDAGYITKDDLPNSPKGGDSPGDAGVIQTESCGEIDLCELANRLGRLEAALLPTVTTDSVIVNTANTAGCIGTVTNGYGEVTARGVCWGTVPNPTVSGSHTNDGTGTGTFFGQLTGLTPGTTYYVRAYATNSVGTSYGGEKSFVMDAEEDTCAAIGATYSENFEGYTSSTVAATGVEPDCWELVREDVAMPSGKQPQLYYKSSVAHSGDYFLRLYYRGVYAMPALSDDIALNSLKLGMYLQQPKAQYRLQVGVWENDSVFVPVALINNSSTEMEYVEVDFSSYTGSGNRIAFRNVLSSSYSNSYSYNYLDDIMIVPASVALDEKSCPGTPTVTDHEGNVYATVQIGEQCWMRDNLRTTTSPSTGTYLIPAVGTGHTYTGKQALWYNNDSASYAPMNYGLLYNWNAAADTFNTAYWELSVNTSSSNAVSVTFNGPRRGICPAGWHLPSDAEWTQLENYMGSQSEYTCGGDSSNIAKALASTEGWDTNTKNCVVGNDQSVNNATGFSAVPAGDCWGSMFYGAGIYATFWSATQSASGPGSASSPFLYCNRANVGRSSSTKNYEFSVRCLRDESGNADTTVIPTDITVTPDDTTTVTAGVPCPNVPTVTDYDGNVYNTVLIGTLCWMKENLRTTHFADGTAIPNGGSSAHHYSDNYENDCSTDPYYYDYNGSGIPLEKRGYLYNWVTANQACPAGWHLPRSEEWTALTNYVDSRSEYQCGSSNDIAKALASEMGWNSSTNNCAVGNDQFSNNATGFSIVPTGYCADTFSNAGIHAYFWTSSVRSTNTSWSRELHYDNSSVIESGIGNFKSQGLSVRCLRDSISNGSNITTPQDTSITNYGSPCPNTPTVTDHEGNVYHTVQIGEQCWTKENLRTTTSPTTGTYLIPAAGTGHTYTGKQARWYNNDSATYAPMSYGLLYNWNAAVDTFNSAYGETSVNNSGGDAVSVTFNGRRRGICPMGWHLPSDAEWSTMISYVGSRSEYMCGGNPTYIAKALADSVGWSSHTKTCAVGNNQSANNAAGFSAVPAGSSFHQTGYGTYFWSSSQYVGGWYYAHGCYLSYDEAYMDCNHYGTSIGFSVRCLRDESGNADTTVIPTDTTVTPDDTTTVTAGVPCPGTPTVTDHEGNVYATVQIGDQCWMRDNLRTTTSPSTGTYLIPAVGTGNTYTGKQARWYNNDSATYAPMNYGLLYNWNAAVDTFNAAFGELSVNTSSSNAVSVTFNGHRRGICPAGWHLPSDAEWTAMTNYVKSQNEYLCDSNTSYIAKALANSLLWNSSTNTCAVGNNLNSNNATGFSAVPAGRCNGSSFYDTGSSAFFWSSSRSVSYTDGAYDRALFDYRADVNRGRSNESSGFSVRCLRD